MSEWQRRLRAALGMGLMWGAAWFGAGMAMMLGMLLATGSTGADVPYPVGFGAIGFVGGLTFSGVLGLKGRGRRFEEMSLSRVALWGAGAGTVLSGLFVTAVALAAEGPGFFANLPLLAGVFSLAGAGSAAGIGALARASGGDERLEAADGGAGGLLADGRADPDSTRSGE